MSGLRPSATTVNVAAEVCQPLLLSGVQILPSMCIGSFENVRNCGFLISRTHIACGLLLTTRAASGLFKMLKASPVSTIRVVEIFLFLMGKFKRLICFEIVVNRSHHVVITAAVV